MALVLLSLTAAAAAQQENYCGEGTTFNSSTSKCSCLDPLGLSGHHKDVITLAGISGFNDDIYYWGPDIFEVTVNLMNEGWWDLLPPATRVEYSIGNSMCDEGEAMKSYWNIRTSNGNMPVHGIVGARCSGASKALARLAGLESVPVISPSSNSAALSDKKEFPYFSRLVAPNNEFGEGKLT